MNVQRQEETDTVRKSVLSCKAMRELGCVKEMARMTRCVCETAMSCSYEPIWVIIETVISDSCIH